jgi:hypothetical protein
MVARMMAQSQHLENHRAATEHKSRPSSAPPSASHATPTTTNANGVNGSGRTPDWRIISAKKEAEQKAKAEVDRIEREKKAAALALQDAANDNDDKVVPLYPSLPSPMDTN